MKKIYSLFLLFMSAFAFGQSNYPGNGNESFGGPVGKGSLDILDDGTIITFKFNKGTNNFNDALVIYIDAKTGGFTTTSSFTDKSDGLRSAISGFGTEKGADVRSSLTWSSANFIPDYAVAFSKDFAGVWELKSGAEHTFIASANLTPSESASSPLYTFTVDKAAFIIAGSPAFKFFATYTSQSAFRSTEAIGDPMTGFTQGWNPQTVEGFNTYPRPALPVKLVDFSAVKDKNMVQLKWMVAQESNIDNYQIQRSANGIQFSSIQTIKARNQSVLQPIYTTTDTRPVTGKNYYRLAITENGRQEYGPVKVVTMGKGSGSIAINYTSGTTKLNIRLLGKDAGAYTMNVVNTLGQVMQSTKFEHDGAEVNRSFDMRSGLARGIYRVVLFSDTDKVSQAFMVH